jgi:hypothetical protein
MNAFDPKILGQNVAAISAEFHGGGAGDHSSQYTAFYNRFCDDFEGFPGIWAFMALAGIVFTELEQTKKIDWDEFDWILTIQRFAETIHDAGIKEKKGAFKMSDERKKAWLRNCIELVRA